MHELEASIKLRLTPIDSDVGLSRPLFELIEDEIIEQYPPILTIGEGTPNELSFLVEIENVSIKELNDGKVQGKA